ncbi:MAG: hypothetical protein HRU19_15050 [Pseudobacteriovorax sp.]|nr:hypothetical protein [Pseudobacteriovorax sp.]
MTIHSSLPNQQGSAKESKKAGKILVGSGVVLYITRPDETKNCNFWIGAFEKGSSSINDIYSCKSIKEVYAHMVEKGIVETQPLLIANTEIVPPETYYFVPKPMLLKEPNTAISHIINSINAMKPERAGIYFSPSLLSKNKALSILKHTVLQLAQTQTKEFYLYAGEHGINPILNIALDIKKQLEASSDVLVFH